MKLYLVVTDDEGNEMYEIGSFDSTKDLESWAQDTDDEDIFQE